MELMIAISVLSIILMISAYVLTGIGGLYSKGTNYSNVQNASRNIIQDLSSDIQFSNSPVIQSATSINHDQAICIGNIRYSYTIFNFSSVYAIWKDQMTYAANSPSQCVSLNLNQASPSCTGTSPGCIASVPNSGENLAGPNMRVGQLNVIGGFRIYSISIELIDGIDKNMFTKPPNSSLYYCSNQSGQQYCAVSILSTVAARRLD